MKKYFIFALIIGALIMPRLSLAATSAEIQAQINAIMAQIQALQQQVTQLQAQQGTTAVWCHDFNTNLKFGDSGNEVAALKTALSKEGFALSEGTEESAIFDQIIASAVTGFQQKYASEILAPWGLQYGSGYVGRTTRAKLNSLYGCGIVPIPTPVPTPVCNVSITCATGYTPYDTGEKDSNGCPIKKCISSTGNQPPRISGVSGPMTLKVNEIGTWTINASDPEQEVLTYQVFWGDEAVGASAQLSMPSTYTQTATFTHSYSKAGIYNPTFAVTDNQGLFVKTRISVNVGGVIVTPSITTTSLPNGTVGVTYTASVSAFGGNASYFWSATGLPAGLNIDGTCDNISDGTCSYANARIFGIPTTAGTYTVNVALTSGTQSVSKQFSLVIAAAGTLTITTNSLSSGTVGVVYTASISATGGSAGNNYFWSATGLPAGLSILGSMFACSDQSGTCAGSGNLSGTPTIATTAGTYTVNVTVTSGTQSVSKQFSLVINAAGTLAITTNSLPSGTVGQSYSTSISASGGSDPYAWRISSGTLPPGLSLNYPLCIVLPCQAPVRINGAPTTVGTYTVNVTVISGTQSVSKQFTISIVAAGVIRCDRCSVNSSYQWVSFDSTDSTCATVVPSTNPVTRTCNCSCPGGLSNNLYPPDCSSQCAVIPIAVGELRGKVLKDDNGNGIQDSGEVYLRDPSYPTCSNPSYIQSGIAINYSGPANGSTSLNQCSAITGDPIYSLSNLLPIGNYTVSVTVPSGWQATAARVDNPLNAPCASVTSCSNVPINSGAATVVVFSMRPTAVTPSTPSITVAKLGTGSGTVTSNPSGIDCGFTCAVTYTSGTSVTLTASPASGSTFAGWSGDCSGTGTCTVSMVQARNVTVTFDTIVYATCAPPVNLRPTGVVTATSGKVNLFWDPVPGVAYYNVRLNDGTTNRYDDPRFTTCEVPSPHYYCENNISATQITDVPVVADKTYLFWIDPIYSPNREYCKGQTTFTVSSAGALAPSGQYSASMLENIKASLDQIQKAINDWH